MSRRIAVFASGSGSNLQAILDYFARPEIAPLGQVVVVASDRPSCGALDRARTHGVDAVTCAPDEMASLLAARRIDLIALAGFLRFVPDSVTHTYADRIVNVHPALLPAFGGAGMYGRRVHEAVLEAGVRVTGATVHFVNNVYDSGAIIAQWPVPVLDGDTPDALAGRVLRVEHLLFPRTLAAVAAGRGRLTGPLRTGDPQSLAFAPLSSLDEAATAMASWLGVPV